MITDLTAPEVKNYLEELVPPRVPPARPNCKSWKPTPRKKISPLLALSPVIFATR
jgi:hypothetical protein